MVVLVGFIREKVNYVKPDPVSVNIKRMIILLQYCKLLILRL